MHIPESSKRWLMHLEQAAKTEVLEAQVATLNLTVAKQDARLKKLEAPPKKAKPKAEPKAKTKKKAKK